MARLVTATEDAKAEEDLALFATYSLATYGFTRQWTDCPQTGGLAVFSISILHP